MFTQLSHSAFHLDHIVLLPRREDRGEGSVRPGVWVVLLHVLPVHDLVDGEGDVEDDDGHDELVDRGEVGQQDAVGEHLDPPDQAQYRQGQQGGELKYGYELLAWLW